MIVVLRQLLAALLSFVLAASAFSNTYDNVGNLQSVTYPNGVVHSYGYDTRNRLTNLGVNHASAPLASYAYTLDAAGHRTAVTEQSGRSVNYGYDNLYRLTSESIASDPNAVNGAVNYSYDAVGNRTQMTSTLAAVPAGTFNYDANDRFTIGDGYDANGNTTASGGLGYVYDFENHLIQQGGLSIAYDGDGNRVSKVVAGTTTTYLVDTENPTGYAQVVTEGTGSFNSAKTVYVYGLERISQNRRFASSNPISYYVYDGHGSVRALTDPTGAVTDSYDYDAFGNLIHSSTTLSSPTPNNYLFAGEQFDPDLHLYYNRARYLNTSTGRFWSGDSDDGDPTEPISLHRYLYASADPVDRIDPDGNEDFSLAGTVGSLPVAATIAAFSVISLATGCAVLALVAHGPGICGSKNEPLTLYRGLSGRNPGQIKPEYFSGDGLSLYETLYPGNYRFKLPFVIDYLAPKTPGTMAVNIYIPPFLDEIANITYTPEFEDPTIGEGHWSLQLKPGIALTADIIKLLIVYLKDAALPF